MKYAIYLLVCLLAAPSFGQDGVIVRAGDGEELMNGILMLLSPKVGSEAAILAEQTFPPGGQTIVHAHDQGDELFYVVAGRGRARLGDRYEEVGPGDAILVSAGQTHQISNPFDENLTIIGFMATPELAEQARAVHARLLAEPDRPLTDEEDEELTRRFGGQRKITE